MSSNPSTVTVDTYGKLHALASGTAVITVKSVQDQTKLARATVVVPVNVSGITLNTATSTLKAGKTLPLRATMAPSNAAVKTLVWSTDKPAVATVSENGVVTAVGSGVAVITATTTDGGYTVTATITVSP